MRRRASAPRCRPAALFSSVPRSMYLLDERNLQQIVEGIEEGRMYGSTFCAGRREEIPTGSPASRAGERESRRGRLPLFNRRTAITIGEVGLSGAGGTDPEGEGRLLDRAHELALTGVRGRISRHRSVRTRVVGSATAAWCVAASASANATRRALCERRRPQRRARAERRLRHA